MLDYPRVYFFCNLLWQLFHTAENYELQILRGVSLGYAVPRPRWWNVLKSSQLISRWFPFDQKPRLRRAIGKLGLQQKLTIFSMISWTSGTGGFLCLRQQGEGAALNTLGATKILRWRYATIDENPAVCAGVVGDSAI